MSQQRINSKRGFSLPAAMAITSVLVILSASLIIIAANSISSTTSSISSRQAYLNVRSALEYALSYYNDRGNISDISKINNEYLIMNDVAGGTTNEGAFIGTQEQAVNYTTYVQANYIAPQSGSKEPAAIKFVAYSKSSDAFGKRTEAKQLAATYTVNNFGSRNRVTLADIDLDTQVNKLNDPRDVITLHFKQYPGEYWSPFYYIWTYKDVAKIYSETDDCYGLEATLKNTEINGQGKYWTTDDYGNKVQKSIIEGMNENEYTNNILKPAGAWDGNNGTPSYASSVGNGWYVGSYYIDSSQVNYFNLILTAKGKILRDSLYTSEGTYVADNVQTNEMFHLWYLNSSDKHIYFEFLKKGMKFYAGEGWNGLKGLDDSMLVYVKNQKTAVHFKVKGIGNSDVNIPLTTAGEKAKQEAEENGQNTSAMTFEKMEAPSIDEVRVGGVSLFQKDGTYDSFSSAYSSSFYGASNLQKSFFDTFYVSDPKNYFYGISSDGQKNMIYEGCGWWVSNIQTGSDFYMTITYYDKDNHSYTNTILVTPNSEDQAYVVVDLQKGTIQSRLSEARAMDAIEEKEDMDSYVTVHLKSSEIGSPVAPRLDYTNANVSSEGRRKLLEAIIQAENYYVDDYTEASYAVLSEKIAEAITMYNNDNYIQSVGGLEQAEKDYAAKIQEIEKAIKGLIDKSCKVETRDKLIALIKEVDALKAEYTAEKNYDLKTYESFTKSTSTYSKAVEIAKKLSQSATAVNNYSTSTVVDYIEKLTKEFNALKLTKIDKTKLDTAIKLAEKYYKNARYQEKYTKALLDEVGEPKTPGNAREILSDPWTQKDLDDEADYVNELIEDVKAHSNIDLIDTSVIVGNIKTANALLNRTPKTDCTDETYEALDTALTSAQSAFEDPNATQETLNGANEVLEKAIKNFEVLKPKNSIDSVAQEYVRIWFKGFNVGSKFEHINSDGTVTPFEITSFAVNESQTGSNYIDVINSSGETIKSIEAQNISYMDVDPHTIDSASITIRAEYIDYTQTPSFDSQRGEYVYPTVKATFTTRSFIPSDAVNRVLTINLKDMYIKHEDATSTSKATDTAVIDIDSNARLTQLFIPKNEKYEISVETTEENGSKATTKGVVEGDYNVLRFVSNAKQTAVIQVIDSSGTQMKTIQLKGFVPEAGEYIAYIDPSDAKIDNTIKIKVPIKSYKYSYYNDYFYENYSYQNQKVTNAYLRAVLKNGEVPVYQPVSKDNDYYYFECEYEEGEKGIVSLEVIKDINYVIHNYRGDTPMANTVTFNCSGIPGGAGEYEIEIEEERSDSESRNYYYQLTDKLTLKAVAAAGYTSQNDITFIDVSTVYPIGMVSTDSSAMRKVDKVNLISTELSDNFMKADTNIPVMEQKAGSTSTGADEDPEQDTNQSQWNGDATDPTIEGTVVSSSFDYFGQSGENTDPKKNKGSTVIWIDTNNDYLRNKGTPKVYVWDIAENTLHGNWPGDDAIHLDDTPYYYVVVPSNAYGCIICDQAGNKIGGDEGNNDSKQTNKGNIYFDTDYWVTNYPNSRTIDWKEPKTCAIDSQGRDCLYQIIDEEVLSGSTTLMYTRKYTKNGWINRDKYVESNPPALYIKQNGQYVRKEYSGSSYTYYYRYRAKHQDSPPTFTYTQRAVDRGNMAAIDLKMAFVGGNRIRMVNESYWYTYGTLFTKGQSAVTSNKKNASHNVNLSIDNLFGGDHDNQEAKGDHPELRGNAFSANRVGDTKLQMMYDWYEYKIPVDQGDVYTIQFSGVKYTGTIVNSNKDGSGQPLKWWDADYKTDLMLTNQISNIYGDVWVKMDNITSIKNSKLTDMTIYTRNPEDMQIGDTSSVYFKKPIGWTNIEITASGVGDVYQDTFAEDPQQNEEGYLRVDIPTKKPFLTITAIDANGNLFTARTSLQGNDDILFDPKLNAGTGGWEEYIPTDVKLQRALYESYAIYHGSVLAHKYDSHGNVDTTQSPIYYRAEAMNTKFLTSNFSGMYLNNNYKNVDYDEVDAWNTAYKNLYTEMSKARAYIGNARNSDGTLKNKGEREYPIYPEFLHNGKPTIYDKNTIENLYTTLVNSENTYKSSSATLEGLTTQYENLKAAIDNVAISTDSLVTAIFYDCQNYVGKKCKFKLQYTKTNVTAQYDDRGLLLNGQTEEVQYYNTDGMPIVFINSQDAYNLSFVVYNANGTIREVSTKKDAINALEGPWVYIAKKNNPYWLKNSAADYRQIDADKFIQTQTPNATFQMKQQKVSTTETLTDAKSIEEAKKKNFKPITLYFQYDTTVSRQTGTANGAPTFATYMIRAGAYTFQQSDFAADSSCPMQYVNIGTASKPNYVPQINLYTKLSEDYFKDSFNYGEYSGAKAAWDDGVKWVNTVTNSPDSTTGEYKYSYITNGVHSYNSDVNMTVWNGQFNANRIHNYITSGNMYFRWQANKPLNIYNNVTFSANELTIASSGILDASKNYNKHFYLTNPAGAKVMNVIFITDITVKYLDRYGTVHQFTIREGEYEIEKAEETQTFVADLCDENYWTSMVYVTPKNRLQSEGEKGSTPKLVDPVYE